MNDYYTHFALKQYFIFYILTDQVQRKTLREIHIRTLSSFRLGGVEMVLLFYLHYKESKKTG